MCVEFIEASTKGVTVLKEPRSPLDQLQGAKVYMVSVDTISVKYIPFRAHGVAYVCT